MAVVAPVMNREPNDCALCATEYVARVFDAEVDRATLKGPGNWDPKNGSSLHVVDELAKHGLQVSICRPGLPMVSKDDGVRGPDWRSPMGEMAIRQMYRTMFDLGFIGVTGTQVHTPHDHAVVVEGLNRNGGLTVVCSLRGRYTVPFREFVFGHEQLHGVTIHWVRRP